MWRGSGKTTRSSLRADPACEERRGGDVDQLDDNYKLYLSFTVAVENKERSFSFTIAEENIHRHGWTAQQSMVWYYIESCSLGFVFRMIPSTRSDGEARAFSAQRHRQVLSLIGETQRNWFRCEHPLFTL